MTGKPRAVVVGAGPAGLMAAETMAARGLDVVVCDAMASVGRKFLMAGKSGLNLTKDESTEAAVARLTPCPPPLAAALRDFGPAEVRDWAEGLGQPLFTGSTGRVFPVAMKASPLLRAWLSRLADAGVSVRTRMRWRGWRDDALLFDTAAGDETIRADVAVLALGGASWPRLGSDGAWTAILADVGQDVAPFRPANMGFRVRWSDRMARHAGTPVKGVALAAGPLHSRGEWVVAASGIEGGGVYEVSAAHRDGAPMFADLMPDLPADEIERRLARPRGKASLANHLRRRLGLDPVARDLLTEFARPLPQQPGALARVVKALPIATLGPYPVETAISTAGGLAWSGLDGFMLTSRPGTFAAGEMLDWEAPTGGYLLTACLAAGRAAGTAAADRALG